MLLFKNTANKFAVLDRENATFKFLTAQEIEEQEMLLNRRVFYATNSSSLCYYITIVIV